jgi:hypothetical protein
VGYGNAKKKQNVWVEKHLKMSNKQTYFRVCHKDTLQGLWYTYGGEFTGLIHNEFGFCQNNALRMDFDEEIVGWLSAVETLDNLFHWFTQKDINELQKHGWYIHEFEAEDVKFYERFQHTVIKQGTSKVVMVHELMRNGATREYDENRVVVDPFEGMFE